MAINIKDLDKVKLFARLYNHIQANTTFGQPEKVLKHDEDARHLLATHRFDYAHFGIFCDLNQDEVDPSKFNTLYGNGIAVFEKIVSALRKETSGNSAQNKVSDSKNIAEANQNNSSGVPNSIVPQSISNFISYLWNSAPKSTAGSNGNGADSKKTAEQQKLDEKSLVVKPVGHWAKGSGIQLSDVSIQLMTELQKEIQLLEIQQQRNSAGTILGWLSQTLSPPEKSNNQLALEDCLDSIDFLCGNDFPSSAVTVAKTETMENVSEWFRINKPDSPIPKVMSVWWKEMYSKGRGCITTNFEPNKIALKMQ